MVAASRETGAAERTTNSPSSPYEAVTVTDSVFSLWRPLFIQRTGNVIL